MTKREVQNLILQVMQNSSALLTCYNNDVPGAADALVRKLHAQADSLLTEVLMRGTVGK